MEKQLHSMQMAMSHVHRHEYKNKETKSQSIPTKAMRTGAVLFCLE